MFCSIQSCDFCIEKLHLTTQTMLDNSSSNTTPTHMYIKCNVTSNPETISFLDSMLNTSTLVVSMSLIHYSDFYKECHTNY